MNRIMLPLAALGGFTAMLLVVYYPILFLDRQFAWDNASYFYYPLYQTVQQEWKAGRWPLWNAGMDGGVPLLGNPVAAVFYPIKLVYAALPYSWGARLYIVAHTIIAFAGVLRLCKSFGLSGNSSLLAGLSYGFGAPILCLYSNVIFLVGASWLPWALSAVDRLLRRGIRGAAIDLSVYLSLQVLGGDPEAAYLTVVCGAIYAVLLSLEPARSRNPRWIRWGILGAILLYVAVVLGSAAAGLSLLGSSLSRNVTACLWLTLAGGLAWRWYRRPGTSRLTPRLARLAGGCVLACALSAVQLLPSLEFASRSWRASGIGESTLFGYSLNPVRLVEFAWPNVFGVGPFEGSSWLSVVSPAGGREMWVASLYMGGFTLLLGLTGCGWKSGPPWRPWMTAIAMVGLLGSLGKYGGPLWWARWTLLSAVLGSHDLPIAPVTGHRPGDASGSVYGLMTLLLPGFDSFRYPSKLLPLLSLSLSVLAGLGWDLCTQSSAECRRFRRLIWFALGLSLIGLVLASSFQGRAIRFISAGTSVQEHTGTGRMVAAWGETRWSLIQASTVFAVALALSRWASRSPRVWGTVAIILLGTDLATANRRLIWTVPQAEFERAPEVASLIKSAEQAEPTSGPFRIHRLVAPYPTRPADMGDRDYLEQSVRWSRETLFPLHGLPQGFEYCATTGPLELQDHASYFQAQVMPLPAETARVLGSPAGRPVAYYPRRSFDLWGARYFILPAVPDWSSPTRGFASFLNKTDLIYPAADVLYDTEGKGGVEPWRIRNDWQLRRNRDAYPRAWVVHHALIRREAASAEARADLMRTLVYMNDPIWTEPNRPIFDLRQSAIIETEDPQPVVRAISRTPVGPAERVKVVSHRPDRVELKASLERAGLVILADSYYPGWRLTIDGRPSPILRANRMMRGAVVSAGEHTLIYSFEPLSFQMGAIVSLGGLAAAAVMLWRSRRDYARRALDRDIA